MAGLYTGYLSPGLRVVNRTKIIQAAFQDLKKREGEFDCIAFRGMSGALVAPVLAYLLDKAPVIVRKSMESSHSSSKAEGQVNSNARYLIVDDFTSGGGTLSAIVEAITSIAPDMKPVGVYYYARIGRDYPEASEVVIGDKKWSLPVWSHCDANGRKHDDFRDFSI